MVQMMISRMTEMKEKTDRDKKIKMTVPSFRGSVYKKIFFGK